MIRVLAALLVVGCASASNAPASPGASWDAPEGDEAPGSVPDGSSGSDATALASAGLPSPEPPPGAKSLPELLVRTVGLHVGGGRNDRASKEPYLNAVEQRFTDFLDCYRLVDVPGDEGTFGIELVVGASGVVERTDKPRPGLSGEAFRSCMLQVFQTIAFEPTKAPVIVSYSVRFSLDQ